MLAWHRMAAFFRDPHLDLTWQQFCDWQAYFEMEPPDYGDNLRTAILAERITNMAGRASKKTAKVADFMPNAKPKGQSAAEQKAFLRGLANG